MRVAFERIDQMEKVLEQLQVQLNMQQHLMLANCQFLTPEQRSNEFATYQNAILEMQNQQKNAAPGNIVK